jgi:hypothetical protein
MRDSFRVYLIKGVDWLCRFIDWWTGGDSATWLFNWTGEVVSRWRHERYSS